MGAVEGDAEQGDPEEEDEEDSEEKEKDDCTCKREIASTAAVSFACTRCEANKPIAHMDKCTMHIHQSMAYA